MSDEKNYEQQAEFNLQNEDVHEDAQLTQEDLNSSSAAIIDDSTSYVDEQNPAQEKLPFEYQENKIANLLAVLAAFLFVLGLGFLVYKQFISTKMSLSDNFESQITQEAASTVRDEEEKTAEKTSSRLDDLKTSLKERFSNNDKEDEKSEEVEEEKTEPAKAEITEPDAQTVAGVMTGEWQANDYKQGEIKKGSYTVKAGDTLWEIAEAVYGDGSQWVNILNANSGSVDYLPSGQQSLIYAGQVLAIP